MTQHSHPRAQSKAAKRAGQASLDWVLVLATMLPIVAFIVTNGKKMMALVWEMLSVQVSWPFM